MIIECSECGTKNQTDKLPQSGKKYRCGKCGAVITFLETVDVPTETTSFLVTEGSYQSVINTQIDLYNILRRRIPELPEDELLNKLIFSRINALPKAGSDEQEYYEPLLGNHNKSLEDVIYAMIHYEFILSRASEAITKGQEMGLTSDQITELWGDFGEKVRNDIRVSIRKIITNKSSS